MKKRMWNYLWIAILLIVACASEEKKSPPSIQMGAALNGEEFGILTDIVVSGNKIEGSGGIVFRTPLAGDDNNYALRFSLEENGSLTLVPNADAKLNALVSLKLTRKSDGNLGIVLIEGNETTDLEGDLAPIAADKEIFLQLDFHAHGHFIIWINGESEPWESKSSKGLFWGLKLDKASVTEAKVGPPKQKHN